MKISEKPGPEIIKLLTTIANNFDSTKENYLLSYPTWWTRNLHFLKENNYEPSL